MVGDDIAVLVDDEAGSGLLLAKRAGGKVLAFLAALAATEGAVAEEPTEQVRAFIAVALVALFRSSSMRVVGRLGSKVRRDVHHGWLQPFGQLGEFVAKLHRVRNHQRGSVGSRHLASSRMHAGVDKGADHDSNGERDEHEAERQHFLLPNPVKATHVGVSPP